MSNFEDAVYRALFVPALEFAGVSKGEALIYMISAALLITLGYYIAYLSKTDCKLPSEGINKRVIEDQSEEAIRLSDFVTNAVAQSY